MTRPTMPKKLYSKYSFEISDGKEINVNGEVIFYYI